MSSGWVRIDRAMFGHGAFRGPADWGAWMWLISEARWREAEVMISGEMLTLQRGQLSHSVRYMAQALGLSKNGVQGLLKRFEKWGLVETSTGTGQTIITICNYDKYQDMGTSQGQGEDSAGAPEGQGGDSSGTKKNKKTNKQGNNKQESLSCASSGGAVASGQFELVPVTVERDEVREAYEQYCAFVGEYNSRWRNEQAPKLSVPSALTEKRRVGLRKVLGALEAAGKSFEDILREILDGPHLLGFNDRGWTVAIDFVCTETKARKIWEGVYRGKVPRPRRSTFEAMNELMERRNGSSSYQPL
ncbi:hypothetical protein PsAD5_00121 [Pseudovibrio sp. Ad5]|uniref:MarR family transcriptional regulator n=1 Tax=Pseudovibrio sp. Ad5 TaxID=989436 RepID=UPI0007B1D769|nr:helix-turn-helix domain-containing protein [Pseudovibrio sp. Ad5]KZL02172.1 hypothetical protein PsAD5_00121 [Pseudovibrio sp. Ad5]